MQPVYGNILYIFPMRMRVEYVDWIFSGYRHFLRPFILHDVTADETMKFGFIFVLTRIIFTYFVYWDLCTRARRIT